MRSKVKIAIAAGAGVGGMFLAMVVVGVLFIMGVGSDTAVMCDVRGVVYYIPSLACESRAGIVVAELGGLDVLHGDTVACEIGSAMYFAPEDVCHAIEGKSLGKIEGDMYWEAEDEVECHIEGSGAWALPPDLCVQLGTHVGPLDGRGVEP